MENTVMKKISFPPFYFFACIVFMVSFYFLFPVFNLDYYPYNLFGLLLLFEGIFLITKYTRVFNREGTSLQNEKPTSFIQTGFFRYSRNPMYLGGLSFLLGLGIILGNILAYAFPVIFFTIMNFVCIPFEEKIMEDTFKGDYKTYKLHVRRWL